MTGRELIIYILENHLENEVVCADGKILGLLSVEEAAKKFDVGSATIMTWYNLSMIQGVELGNKIYILANAKRPE